jgi:hypothetical protein
MPPAATVALSLQMVLSPPSLPAAPEFQGIILAATPASSPVLVLLGIVRAPAGLGYLDLCQGSHRY